MEIKESYDVIVVGAGPGGALAAKKCAEGGLKTLLLEKRTLPRDKVCTGMIMGPWAHDIIGEEFGDIPGWILADPPFLKGHLIHVSGAEPREINWKTPTGWRRDIDFWMVEKALAADVELISGARFLGLSQGADLFDVLVQKETERLRFQTKFLVGADGATSRVRSTLFPGLKVPYASPLRICYQGSLDMEKDRCHWFFPKRMPRPRFDVNHKDDCFLIEGSGIRDLRSEITETLTKFGYDPSMKPIWKDGCAIALLQATLVDGSFVPCCGNALLVGDAGGMVFPITFEGIGSALMSGRIAGESILEANRTNKPASAIYREKVRPVIHAIGQLQRISKALPSEPQTDMESLSRRITEAYRKTLEIE